MVLHLFCLICFLVYLSFGLAVYGGTVKTRFIYLFNHFSPFSALNVNHYYRKNIALGSLDQHNGY